ncbi:unnamed protein product [Dovyalis caffra]|uniref:Uncharacterized protein n=1 Tax=Dovyalis caffra TaxID=77055 RepID=A0AAV1SLY2_9ROSI|nr:unnamed protein product [Dovyalis caffra]
MHGSLNPRFKSKEPGKLIICSWHIYASKRREDEPQRCLVSQGHPIMHPPLWPPAWNLEEDDRDLVSGHWVNKVIVNIYDTAIGDENPARQWRYGKQYTLP